ncbi:hypothetical protein ILYODFUR_039108 [Ilyodon furcidens]|uniref:Uncharacterized protein n=1 Tax=Ilyodon furcidens TaxID=33524 RepID=A0ABV0T668_9TELE
MKTFTSTKAKRISSPKVGNMLQVLLAEVGKMEEKSAAAGDRPAEGAGGPQGSGGAFFICCHQDGDRSPCEAYDATRCQLLPRCIKCFHSFLYHVLNVLNHT